MGQNQELVMIVVFEEGDEEFGSVTIVVYNFLEQISRILF